VQNQHGANVEGLAPQDECDVTRDGDIYSIGDRRTACLDRRRAIAMTQEPANPVQDRFAGQSAEPSWLPKTQSGQQGDEWAGAGGQVSARTLRNV
jgi:hypothetical protein